MDWVLSNSNDTDIILTSRVRLARNISNIPFPYRLDNEKAKAIIQNINDAVMNSEIASERNLELKKLVDLEPLERLSMVERHIISMDMVDNYEKSATITDNQNISVMINEEDHLRIQVLYPGLNLREAYKLADRIDDAIENKIDYAFDSKLGYLTCCPTNVGTGIRASVMLHLPALTITKNMNNILNAVAQVGLTIRGLYGEGSNIMGNIYQISNQITLGLSEEEILNNLEAITNKIVMQEKAARNMIIEKQSIDLENDIYRSFGILKYSKILSTNECLNLLSRVRMGVEIGLIKETNLRKLNQLLVDIQPATLQLIEGKELDSRDRDIIRAKLVGNNL